MSGEAGGLILIPLALGAIAVTLGSLTVIGVTAMGVKAGLANIKEHRRLPKKYKKYYERT